MFRKLLLTTSAAVLMLVLHTAAQADPFTLAAGQTVTYNFTSSQFAQSTATVTFSLNATGTVLTVTALNTSTNGTFLSGVGFNTTPDVTLQSAAATNNWTAQAGPGGGLGNFELLAFGNGNRNRLSGGQSVTATFTFSSSITSLTLDQVIVHLTSLPNGDSVKLDGTPQPVPEPATMLLLGTGLAGVAAGARRRRKSAQNN